MMKLAVRKKLLDRAYNRKYFEAAESVSASGEFTSWGEYVAAYMQVVFGEHHLTGDIKISRPQLSVWQCVFMVHARDRRDQIF